MRAVLTILLIAFATSAASAQTKAPIVLRDMGSFHVGGRLIEISGQPIKEVVFTPGGVPAKRAAPSRGGCRPGPPFAPAPSPVEPTWLHLRAMPPQAPPPINGAAGEPVAHRTDGSRRDSYAACDAHRAGRRTSE